MTNAWVTYKDAAGTTRRYATPCRRIHHLAKRIAYLARVKPKKLTNYATEITVRFDRPNHIPARVEAATASE